MPTLIEAAAANGEGTVGMPGPKDCKENIAPVDLPQDYLPFSPPPREASSAEEECCGGEDFAANAHTWVSPNKSDEVPSSKESSPDVQSESTVLRGNESFETKQPSSSGEAEEEADDVDDFEATATMEGKPGMNLPIEGQRLEFQKVADVAGEEEVVLDASGKDLIKIIHGEKEVMLVLPSDVTCDLGSTLEIAETLGASLGITDEIVGLKTTALVIDEGSSTFKKHGDCVIPFSALASGQLARMIKKAETEGVPSFNLVTSNFDSYLDGYHHLAPVDEYGEEASRSDESSSISSILQEDALYSEAFLELMEMSDEFDPFEKNTLLRFGIDNAEQGNVLYRASFRVAVFTGDMSYFVQGLKAIAKILLDSRASPSSIDEEASVSEQKEASMTIFGLTDFVISADELYESDDLTAQQYATLLNAIFAGHSSVQSLFDLYHNPDFLVACDSDKELRASLCLRDLLHLGKKLEPLEPRTPQSQDDELLKWAIRTGIHNFAASLSTELCQDFVNIVLHMFSSGDEMVLAACQKFVDTDDSEAVEAMLLREYQIYCRNKDYRNLDCAKGLVQAETSDQSSPVEASDQKKGSAFPDCLLTAVACLVDQNELDEDAAAAVLASYAKGDQLLRDVLDHFIEFGGVDEFLEMIKLVASTRAGQFDTSRLVASSALASEDINIVEDESLCEENAFRAALDEMREAGLFGPVEIAALRLAAARTDPTLTSALSDYHAGDMGSVEFKHALLDVVDSVVEEIDADIDASF